MATSIQAETGAFVPYKRLKDRAFPGEKGCDGAYTYMMGRAKNRGRNKYIVLDLIDAIVYKGLYTPFHIPKTAEQDH